MKKIKVVTVDNKRKRFLIIANISCVVLLAVASIVLLALEIRKNRRENGLIGEEQWTRVPESVMSDFAESGDVLDSPKERTARLDFFDEDSAEMQPCFYAEKAPEPETSGTVGRIHQKWDNVKSFYLYSERGFDYLLLSVGSILFLLFLLCWRLSSRDRRPRIIKETITNVVEPGPEYLKKDDIREECARSYVDALAKRYGFYGKGGTKEFVEWVNNRIHLSNDFKSPNIKKAVLSYLYSGVIVDLWDYDCYVRTFQDVDPDFFSTVKRVSSRFEEDEGTFVNL